jgi:hypothetical protein
MSTEWKKKSIRRYNVIINLKDKEEEDKGGCAKLALIQALKCLIQENKKKKKKLPLSLLGQLFGNVTTYKHCFQIHPQILYKKPTLQNLISISQICYPLLYLLAERGIVPDA